MHEILLIVENNGAEVKIDVTDMPLHEVNKLGTYYSKRGYDVCVGTRIKKPKIKSVKKIDWINLAMWGATIGACIYTTVIIVGAK